MFNLCSTKRCRLSIGRLGISSPCAYLALTLSPVINFPSQFAKSTIGSKVVHQGCCGGQTPKPPGHANFFSFGCFLLHPCSYFRPSHMRPNHRICISSHRTCVLEHSINVAEQPSYQLRRLRSCSTVVTRSGRRSPGK